MKILQINKFLYPKGGDAVCMIDTAKLLLSKGHDVAFWGMAHASNPSYHNADLFIPYIDFNKPCSLIKQLKTASNILYSFESKHRVEMLINRGRPDIIHLHNFAHQISPSILHVFKKYDIPCVMTMHDYKLVCAAYNMLSKDKICGLCKGGRHYHCFLESCIKQSRMKSLLNTLEMYLHHKILKIYYAVNIFISPSIFLKNKIEGMGFRKTVLHLPNFINSDDFLPHFGWEEKAIVYFGRLSKEKGLSTLLKAVRGLNVVLKIIGTGPMENPLKLSAKECNMHNIQFLGYRTGYELTNEIRKSMFVILPSEWYENSPRSIIEGAALGKPAVASRIGGILELVKDNETGLTFEAGNSNDLRSKIEYLINRPNEILRMGKCARTFVEQNLNPEKHYKGLMQIYEQAISIHKRSGLSKFI